MVLGVGVDLVALPVQLVAQHGHLQAVHVRTLALDDARQVPPRRAHLFGVLGHMGKYASIFFFLKDKCIVKEQIKSSFICSNYHRVWGNFKLYILHIVIVLQLRHHFSLLGERQICSKSS